MDLLSWIVGIGILVSSTVGAVALLRCTFKDTVQRDERLLRQVLGAESSEDLSSHGETEGWSRRSKKDADDEETV